MISRIFGLRPGNKNQMNCGSFLLELEPLASLMVKTVVNLVGIKMIGWLTIEKTNITSKRSCWHLVWKKSINGVIGLGGYMGMAVFSLDINEFVQFYPIKQALNIKHIMTEIMKYYPTFLQQVKKIRSTCTLAIHASF